MQAKAGGVDQIGTFGLRQFLDDDEFKQVVIKIVDFNEGLEFVNKNQFNNQMTIMD